jgi:hypothetical protein
MTTVQIKGDTLHVKMNLLEMLFAFRRKLEIPLENVNSIQPEDLPLTKLYRGVRAPGTHVPGLIVAGTYYKDNQRNFWSVRRGQEIITVDLTEDEHYDRLVLGVQDADQIIDKIKERRQIA